MSRLAIHTLGMPRIEYAGNPLAFDRRKAVALLIYLALSDGVRGRDALATLLWPDYDQAQSTWQFAPCAFRAQCCVE